jgi:hypothetical protein
MNKEAGPHYRVAEHQHKTLEIICCPILKHESHHKYSDEKSGCLKELEVKVYICAHWPPNDNTKWDLQAAIIQVHQYKLDIASPQVPLCPAPPRPNFLCQGANSKVVRDNIPTHHKHRDLS